MAYIRAVNTGSGFITHADRALFNIASVGPDMWEVSGNYASWQTRVGGVDTPEYALVIAAAAANAARLSELGATIDADTTISALKAITNAEFNAWWDANVTNAAQAIAVLKRLVRVMIRRVL